MTRTPGTYAVFETSEGTIVCRLFEKDAPKTVANFVELAEGKREWTHPSTRKKTKDPLYHGTIFHRVIPNFMIQGGDPQGTGTVSYTHLDVYKRQNLLSPGRLSSAPVPMNPRAGGSTSNPTLRTPRTTDRSRFISK